MTPRTSDHTVGPHMWPRNSALIDYLRRLPPHRHSSHAAGQVLYLPLTGDVVVPHHQIAGGWYCLVLSNPTGAHRRGDICRRADLEIETALPVALADPVAALPPDDFAAVWLTRIWGRTKGGTLFALCRVLAEQLRRCGTRTLTIDQTARRRVVVAARVLPPGLHLLVEALTRDGFLTHTGEASTYQLTLPDQQRAHPPTSDPPS
jgi:hypothetical protein